METLYESSWSGFLSLGLAAYKWHASVQRSPKQLKVLEYEIWLGNRHKNQDCVTVPREGLAAHGESQARGTGLAESGAKVECAG